MPDLEDNPLSRSLQTLVSTRVMLFCVGLVSFAVAYGILTTESDQDALTGICSLLLFSVGVVGVVGSFLAPNKPVRGWVGMFFMLVCLVRFSVLVYRYTDAFFESERSWSDVEVLVGSIGRVAVWVCGFYWGAIIWVFRDLAPSRVDESVESRVTRVRGHLRKSYQQRREELAGDAE